MHRGLVAGIVSVDQRLHFPVGLEELLGLLDDLSDVETLDALLR